MTNTQTTYHDFSTVPHLFEKYKAGMQILLEGAQIPTGQTPKEIIWTKNKARLYRYEPVREKLFPVPILFIYALINRPYVLDLMPGNSLIEYLVNNGFDVYLLDWGIPSEEDKNLSFEHYILDYMPRAVKRMLKQSGASEYSILGFCMGGTMSAIYASLFPDTPLRNLILLTAPIDFTNEDMGIYGIWMSEKQFNPDHIVEAFGNVPGELIDTGNRMVKPVTNYIGTYVTMWDRLLHDKPMGTWLAMNKWVNDGVPFPGAAFRQWIRDFYQQNKLVKNELILRGHPINLTSIDCSVLSIAGSRDHICTPPQAKAIMSHISSQDKTFVELDAGHVGLLTGASAKNTLWPKIRTWLEERSQ
jgi:polyhydroxyalkanoate synthase